MNVAIAGLDPHDSECLINHSMCERGSGGARIGLLPPELVTTGSPLVIGTKVNEQAGTRALPSLLLERRSPFHQGFFM